MARRRAQISPLPDTCKRRVTVRPGARAALISGPKIHRATTLGSAWGAGGVRTHTFAHAHNRRRSARAQNCSKLENRMQSQPVGGTGTCGCETVGEQMKGQNTGGIKRLGSNSVPA